MDGKITLDVLDWIVLLVVSGAGLLVLATGFVRWVFEKRDAVEKAQRDEGRTQGWRDNATAHHGRLELYDPANPGEPVVTARLGARGLRRLIGQFEDGWLS